MHGWHGLGHELHWWTHSAEDIERREAQLLDNGRFRWVFVLGLNNSGTSVLQQILGMHPEINGLPKEGQYLTLSLTRPATQNRSRIFATELERFAAYEDNQELNALRVKHDWLASFPDKPGHLLEKSPPNVLRSRWLQRHFQPCSFVALIRNPYAVCEGIVRRKSSVPMETAARHWATGNTALLEDITQLESVLRLSYEELCGDPGGTLGRVEKLLGLSEQFPTACYQNTLPRNNITGTEAPLSNFNTKSFERLSSRDIRTINAIAGATMERLGYARLEPRIVTQRAAAAEKSP